MLQERVCITWVSILYLLVLFSPPCSIGTRMIEEQKGFVSLWTVDRFYRRQTSSLRGHMDVSKVTHEQMVTPKLWTWLSLQSHMLAVARQ